MYRRMSERSRHHGYHPHQLRLGSGRRAGRIAVHSVETLDIIRAIYSRRAVREYTATPMGRELLAELINDAIQAPSSMNLQPWAFAVFTGLEQLRGYSERARIHMLATHKTPLLEHMLAPGVNIFHDAPALIVICAVNGLQQSAEDCSLAAENLMLSAYARGLGTCPIGFSREWLNLPEIKAELGIPAQAAPAFAVVVGEPKSQPAPHGRNAPLIYTWR